MKRLFTTVIVTALSVTNASAGSLERFDLDDDNFLSFVEMTNSFPSLTRSDFRILDMNDDNRISAVEYVAPGAETIIHRHFNSDYVDFRSVDGNGDKFASISELAAAYPGFHRSDFQAADGNDDGRISSKEFYRPRTQAVLRRYDDGSQILVAIDQLDQDGSGFATLDELMLEYPKLSTVDFQHIDLNKDNRISFTELYDLRAISVLGENR